jgi:hypothetical protein
VGTRHHHRAGMALHPRSAVLYRLHVHIACASLVACLMPGLFSWQAQDDLACHACLNQCQSMPCMMHMLSSYCNTCNTSS